MKELDWNSFTTEHKVTETLGHERVTLDSVLKIQHVGDRRCSGITRLLLTSKELLVQPGDLFPLP